MELIDTHCHLTGKSDEEIAEIVQRAAACDVTRFIYIGASQGVESAAHAADIAEKFPSIWASVGVHPHDAGDYQSLELIESLLSHPRVVAIGETGLDYFRDWAPVPEQKLLFANTIAVAKNCKKPLIVHCRQAADDTLAILKANNAHEVGGVFHCYSEDAEYAKKLADINFRVSFTGNITFKSAVALREAVANIPLSQIMLETDSPYMAPEPFRGKTCEPMYVKIIAEMVAEVKKLSLEEVARETTKNAEEFYRLPLR